jgi:DNA-binding NtrC family response regulator
MTFPLNVLIVEDGPLVMDVLRSVLDDDYQVSCATTVAEALACLSTSVVDLLPDGRGNAVAKVAATLGKATIRMSGHPSENAGIQKAPCLMKPFGAELLLREVRSALKPRLASTDNQR